MKQTLRRYGVLLSLLIFSVGSTAALAADGTPVMTRIQKSGELVLGTSANMDPMTFKQSDGTPAGMDIDLATLMAKAMQVKLVIKILPFDELIPALRSGKVDVVLSNMTINPARNMDVAFVGPYLTSVNVSSPRRRPWPRRRRPRNWMQRMSALPSSVGPPVKNLSAP